MSKSGKRFCINGLFCTLSKSFSNMVHIVKRYVGFHDLALQLC
jgi:hypothetical protein